MKTNFFSIPRSVFIVGCSAFAAAALAAAAQAPSWWTDRGVLDSQATADDFAVINQGQLKHIAHGAYLEFEEHLPGGAGAALDAVINAWQTSDPDRDDFVAVNIGQVKHLASLFYDRLIEVQYASDYPWTGATEPADDYALANIGQVKHLFSFDLTHVAGTNDLPDWWQLFYFGQTDIDQHTDYDGDGFSALEEYQAGTDPTDFYSQPTGPVEVHLHVVAGDAQTGKGNSFTEEPLLVRATSDAAGTEPLPNAPVTFRVVGDHPNLALTNLGYPDTHAEIILRTDATGLARIDDQETVQSLYYRFVNQQDSVHQVEASANEEEVFLTFDTTHELRAHWRMTEESGDVLFDETANELNADLLNGVQRADGVDGSGGIELSSGTDHVNVSPSGQLNFGQNSFSVAAWFKTTATGTRRIVTKGHWSWNTGYLLSIGHGGAAGRVGFGVGGGGQSNSTLFATEESFNDGEWHYVVGVFDFDSERARIYVDGEQRSIVKHGSTGGSIDGMDLDFSELQTLSASHGSYTFRMGAFQSSSGIYERFLGELDDVRVYRGALSEEEILALYQTDTVGNGIADWWEYKYFGQVGIDPHLDYDGDGFTALEEYQAGTDPTDYYNGKLPTLNKVGGDNQWNLPEEWLMEPLMVQVFDGNGNKLQNAPVIFSTTHGLLSDEMEGTTTSDPLEIRTESNGVARVFLKLPATEESNITITSKAESGENETSVQFSAESVIKVAMPVATPPGRMFFTAVEVELSTSTANADIYYTLDGEDPTENDDLYTALIELDETTILKARAFRSGYAPSDIFEAVYYVGGKIVAGPGQIDINDSIPGHSLALRPNGEVWAWGNNTYGQLGDGTNLHRQIPYQVPGITDLIDIGAGWHYSLAVDSAGDLWAWGKNDVGQLGLGDTVNRNEPTQVTGIQNVFAVAGGISHTLAVKSGGTVWAWGNNQYGQLGDDSTTPSDEPVQSNNITGATMVSAGEHHSLALDASGHVWSWGRGHEGRLGHGNTSHLYEPEKIDPANLDDVISIAAGYNHSMALKADGTVWVWGGNSNGQLGLGLSDWVTRSNPTQITQLADIVAIGAGHLHSFAVKENGTVYAWGHGGSGRLGNGSTSSSNVPIVVQIIEHGVSVAGGHRHSLALTKSGEVYGWGLNSAGQVGDGTTETTHVPVPVRKVVFKSKADRPELSMGSGHFRDGIVVTVSPSADGATMHYTIDGTEPTDSDPEFSELDDLVIEETTLLRVRAFRAGYVASETASALYQVGGAMTAGSSHSVALRPDGQVWVWGSNSDGQLGFELAGNQLIPHELNQLSSAITVGAGWHYSSAVDEDGKLWVWGSNDQGQLGLGDTASRESPVEVPNLHDVMAVAGAERHTLAVTADGGVADGGVWAWGNNQYGKLGDGTTTSSHVPFEIAAISDVAMVAAGSDHSVALDRSGRVWTWGRNTSGQLGHGNVSSDPAYREPVEVRNIDDVVAIGAGYGHTVALRGDGTVWTWGSNSNGQLGQGLSTSTDRNHPSQVGGLADIIAIGAGHFHTLAVRADGKVFAWGRGNRGQLGNGTTSQSTSPVEVGVLADGAYVAAGFEHSIGVVRYYGLEIPFSWGLNSNGQLGDFTNINRSTPVAVRFLFDTDNDGLFDYEEYLIGSNPLLADTSGDGVLDFAVWQMGLDPTEQHFLIEEGDPFDPGYWNLPPTDPQETDPPEIDLIEPENAILLP